MITYRVNDAPCSHFPSTGNLLGYKLDLVEKALVFQVTEQSPLVTEFLKKNKFQASNGLFVDISQYPEYKESNLTIYLRGNNTLYNTKVDATPFARNFVAKARKSQIEQALRELVAQVKKIYTPIMGFRKPQANFVYNCQPMGWSLV